MRRLYSSRPEVSADVLSHTRCSKSRASFVEFEFHLTNRGLLEVLVFVGADVPIDKCAVHFKMSAFHKMLISVKPNAPIVKRSWYLH